MRFVDFVAFLGLLRFVVLLLSFDVLLALLAFFFFCNRYRGFSLGLYFLFSLTSVVR
jgi:hypothetical protein